MGILDLLFGRQDDPTLAWLSTEYETPDFDLDNMAFGPLHFGCDLLEAQCFGKPDKFTWSGKDRCELLFAQGGFQLNFESGKLVYIAFFIGKDKFLPDHPAMSFTKPKIKGVAQLSQETTIGDLCKLFGAPESEDRDGEEIILIYSRSLITMEFELDTSGFLKRWNLFPTV
ncbi:MAG: hypothetical protein KKB51_11305 [Candidatus Riflebacteria bacterium]|nr:hypothetical protein [Candidatus Riflebacteria bacterium]